LVNICTYERILDPRKSHISLYSGQHYCQDEGIFEQIFEDRVSDITNLGDHSLQTLVVRFALAELRNQGCPLSAATSGGWPDRWLNS